MTILFINLYIAVKVADKMQKEVTLKRNEIDSLKTKMRWYEDKLDSLSRVSLLTLSLLFRVGL